MALPGLTPGVAGCIDKVVMRRAIFLDRDGVVVVPEFRDGRSYAPRSLETFCLYDDAPASIQRLKDAGFIVVVVTNQPDVGEGLVDLEVIEMMHNQLSKLVPIDDIEMCYHTKQDGCRRRKPLPGMLEDAVKKWDIDVSASFMVGDRLADIQAGQAAGCRTVYIDRGYTAEPLVEGCDARSLHLGDAVAWILEASRSRVGL